jgi:hypothetical protein
MEFLLSFGVQCIVVNLLSKNVKIKINRTIILPIVLYGCETCSLILIEERGLRVSENMVLRRIFEHRRDKVTRDWRKLHNGELLTKYYSGDQNENNEMGGACSTYVGEKMCI